MAVEFEAPIEGMTKHSFGQTQATITNAFEETDQFNSITYEAPVNWDDYAIVEAPSGDYMRTRSTVGSDSKKTWAVLLTEAETYHLRYSVMFESTGGSSIGSDDGFDFGDGGAGGVGMTARTGGKLPGLIKGDPGDNTGLTLVPTAWSGRLMWRGGNNAGVGLNTRDFVTLSLYYYGQEAEGETGLGSANTYWFNGNNHATRFGRNGTPGTGPGQYGDTTAFKLKTDVWYHLKLSYFVPDSSSGTFTAETWEDGVDTDWQTQLTVTGMRYMQSGNSGIDAFLYQNFWGGATADWRPGQVGYMRFKDFGVYTTETEAAEAFGLSGVSTVFAVTSPANAATDVSTPLSVSGTAEDDSATNYQVKVQNTTGGVTVSDYGDVAITHTGAGETWSTDSSITIPQGGQTLTVTPRRLV